MRFNIYWFLPEGSHVHDALAIQNVEFGGTRWGFTYTTGSGLPYPSTHYLTIIGGVKDGKTFVDYTSIEVQQALDSLIQVSEDSTYIAQCEDWWTYFAIFFRGQGTNLITVDGVEYLASSAFYPVLEDFLNGPGLRYRGAVDGC